MPIGAGRLAKIGVLAIQGDFDEHRLTLRSIGVDSKEVRLPEDLESLTGLIIPGGESTTMVQLIDAYGLRNPIKEFAEDGMGIWGTCAGMIVIADKLIDKRPSPLGLMNIEVSRNAFGRQRDSFEAHLSVSQVEGPPVHALFIRAPIVTKVEDGVEILAQLETGEPVAVRQGKLLATSFHPELTGDTRMHQLFIDITQSNT
mgnify:CR=1 FL=1